ncbi:MAG TPA: ferrochelatase [Terriglobales bacterium]|nr:ferrochelatase [Terriglobales bacterium]
MAADPKPTAVLLLAHGSPDRAEEVPEFLKYVTGGRPMPPAAVEEIAHRYSLIGSSPLTQLTMQQGQALARALRLPVYVGMRNWKPFIPDVVKTMVADGAQHVIAICMAPQNSRTSVGLYRRAVEAEQGAAFGLDFVESWHDHPLLARAFAEKLRIGWNRACVEAGEQVPVIFTAHSVPQRTITDGDPYEAQAYETAQLVAQAADLGQDDWLFAFQSQGLSGGPWIGPTVEDMIVRCKEKGHSSVFIQPIGFLCDHVEILYDIDIAFRDFAEKKGMRLRRADSLNDSPTLTAALADLARSRMQKPDLQRRA